MTLYFVGRAIFLAGFLLIYQTIHSPFGQVLKSIRENELRAVSLGYAADRHKLLAFALSAALAGLAIVHASCTTFLWGPGGALLPSVV